MNPDVYTGEVPSDSVPFGFRGLPSLKTSNNLNQSSALAYGTARLYASGSGITAATLSVSGATDLTGSFVPPVPLRFKCTKGNVDVAGGFAGKPGLDELADSRYYWGVKFERCPPTGTLANSIFNSNASSEQNKLVKSYTKLLGIAGLDALVTGSSVDAFNSNKFTLSRVALGNRLEGSTLVDAIHNKITGSANEHMLEAAYIRNGVPDMSNYSVSDGTLTDRITLGSLVSITSSVYFNKFVDYNKFSNFFYGGFDGVNILDSDMARLNDRAASSDPGGKAAGSLDIGLRKYTGTTTLTDYDDGIGQNNNIVMSYKAGAKIMTDPMVTRINILAIPGQRDSFITDYASSRTREYSQAIYLMDIPAYTDGIARIFDNDEKKVDTTKTIQQFAARALDNNYVAAYYPDVSLRNIDTGRVTRVAASVAALSALGFNDAVSYPWFAPAGFNRAALSSVANTAVRLNKADRDELYDARINPIASFPNAGFVIFGQKTLQQAKSALDRVNVRRMLLEVKRLISNVARKIVFEQNTPTTRSRFISQIMPLLTMVQQQQGIDEFRVVMDASNNSQDDIESNRLNGRIVLVPTRAVEFISVDFIITNAGVSFD